MVGWVIFLDWLGAVEDERCTKTLEDLSHLIAGFLFLGLFLVLFFFFHPQGSSNLEDAYYISQGGYTGIGRIICHWHPPYKMGASRYYRAHHSIKKKKKIDTIVLPFISWNRYYCIALKHNFLSKSVPFPLLTSSVHRKNASGYVKA